MAAKETGKQRAARIPLDYYNHPSRLERWKDWLGLVAVLVSGGWLATGLLCQDGDRRYSRGPVANVHQTWDANCAACHEAFVPIQSDHWAANWMPSWFASTRKDHQCTSCHSGAIHHRNESTTLSCVACHHEHRGRDASLVRLADRDCTQCHADLAAFVKPGEELTTPKEMLHIRGFSKAEGHGDFQRLVTKAAEQKLKFSHDRHLAPGMWTADRGDAKFTLGKLAPADRNRYEAEQRDKGDSAPVQLQCASCHQLDVAGKSPERPAGDYMLPIRYEAHCQACHPLTIERGADKDRQSSQVAVPHRLQPQDIRRYLEGLYTDKVFKDDLKAFETFVGKRPLPGKAPAEKSVRQYYDAIAKAEKNLFYGNKTCGECHHYDPADALSALQADSSEPPKFRIAPTRVPQVWFKHALFNHAAHRAIDCRSCHEDGLEKDGTTPITLSKSDKSEQTFIPKMGKCVECHAPQTTVDGSIKGGARHDCTECHRYHNGDHALQGMGAERRDPRARRPIEAFLNTGKQEQQ